MKPLRITVFSIMIILLTASSTYAHPIYPIRQCDVLIDAGHGGIDGGASYKDILEKDINLAISRKLYAELVKMHYHVILNRTEDYALSDDNEWLNTRSRHLRDLAQRGGLAQEASPRVYISLHTNWTSHEEPYGPMVLYQKRGQSILLAECIQDALNQLMKTRKNVVKGGTFYLLNHVDTPAVIVESGFLSSAKDRLLLTRARGQEQIAQTVAKAVHIYLSVVDE